MTTDLGYKKIDPITNINTKYLALFINMSYICTVNDKH